jgi:hypothetical protein
MNQEIIIWVLFGTALAYMGFRSWKAVSRKNTSGCAKGCGCETEKSTSKIKSIGAN